MSQQIRLFYLSAPEARKEKITGKMIVTIKTLQQKTFKIELDDTENVEALKQKIEQEQGASFPAANLKLIYAGKILNDANPLSEYNIQESNFVVVMVSKPKPTKATSSSSEATSSQPQQQTATSGATSATPQESSASRESQAEPTQETTSTSTPPTVPTVSQSQSTTTTSTPAADTTAETTDEDSGGTDTEWRSSASALGTCI
jgi:UV excision repair protein RAD23